jgi:hypothetical protein
VLLRRRTLFGDFFFGMGLSLLSAQGRGSGLDEETSPRRGGVCFDGFVTLVVFDFMAAVDS